MQNLLLKIKGNKYVNHSFFRPYLYIYEDSIQYTKRRKIFLLDHYTLSYNHVVQVNRHKGLLFSKIEIVGSGQDSMIIKGVWNRPAKKAKKILDMQSYKAHNKNNHKPQSAEEFKKTEHMDERLSRLKELYKRNKITKKDYEKSKKKILKELH